MKEKTIKVISPLPLPPPSKIEILIKESRAAQKVKGISIYDFESTACLQGVKSCEGVQCEPCFCHLQQK